MHARFARLNEDEGDFETAAKNYIGDYKLQKLKTTQILTANILAANRNKNIWLSAFRSVLSLAILYFSQFCDNSLYFFSIHFFFS